MDQIDKLIAEENARLRAEVARLRAEGHRSQVIQLVELAIVFAFAIAPFWIAATDRRDLSELKASLVGAAGLTMVGLYKVWKGKHTDEDKT